MTRPSLVDRSVGSVRTGFGLCALAAGGSLDTHVHSFAEFFYILEFERARAAGVDATPLHSCNEGLAKIGAELRMGDAVLSLTSGEIGGLLERLSLLAETQYPLLGLVCVGYALSTVTIEDADVVAKSGKTDHPIVAFTGRSEDRVAGTVFEISDAEIAASEPMRSRLTSAFWRRSPPASTPGSMWTRDLRPGAAHGQPRMPTIPEGSRCFRRSDEKGLHADEFEPVRRRDRLAGHLAVAYVQPRPQVRILLQGLAPALVSKREGERQRRVIEREGRGARDRAGHVGDAIVNDAVDHISRFRRIVLSIARVMSFGAAAPGSSTAPAEPTFRRLATTAGVGERLALALHPKGFVRNEHQRRKDCARLTPAIFAVTNTARRRMARFTRTKILSGQRRRRR